jgi:hypothetical protein
MVYHFVSVSVWEVLMCFHHWVIFTGFTAQGKWTRTRWRYADENIYTCCPFALSEASYLLSEIRSSQNGVIRSPSQAQLKQTMTIMPMPSSGLVPGPTTNLNIGMDYWANTASSSPAMHGKATPTAVPGAVVPPEPWMQVSSGTLSCCIIVPYLVFCSFNLPPSHIVCSQPFHCKLVYACLCVHVCFLFHLCVPFNWTKKLIVSYTGIHPKEISVFMLKFIHAIQLMLHFCILECSTFLVSSNWCW